MGLDGELVHAGVRGEHERHDGPEAAAVPLLLEEVRDGAGTGRLLREGGIDGGGEGGRAVVVEQGEEAAQLRDAGVTVGRPLGKEPVERRHGLA